MSFSLPFAKDTFAQGNRSELVTSQPQPQNSSDIFVNEQNQTTNGPDKVNTTTSDGAVYNQINATSGNQTTIGINGISANGLHKRLEIKGNVSCSLRSVNASPTNDIVNPFNA